MEEKTKEQILDERIVELRKDDYTYRMIQLKLGNPSRKYIRQVLLRDAPELAGEQRQRKK